MINNDKQETASSSPTLSTSGSTSGATALSHTTQNAADYLSQLLKDKKQLQAFPNVFSHVDRLLDDEIAEIRGNLFQIAGCEKKPLVLPDPEGSVIQKTEKVYVPSKEHPEYNFVGRILGPRGMTAKQLEQETGCKIMVRGRGSMRDKKKEDNNRGKPNWEHLNDELHVLITVEDTDNRAIVKMNRAIEEVRKLLVPVTEGEDELKKRQLMELAIINGTYRDSSVRNGSDAEAAARLMHSPMSIPLSARTMAGASMGSPLIISPARHLMPQQPHHAYSNSSPAAAPPPLIPAESAAGLLYATAYDAYHHHLATLAAHQHLLGDVSYPTTTTANNGDGMHVSGMISLANR